MASGGVEGSAELRIDGAAKRFGEVAALDGVSLQVARGELLTILGPSGSGKTTLLKVVAGFEKPDAGSVRIDGVEITALPPAGTAAELTVRVGGVPGEKNTDNNRQTYTILFGS